MTKDIDAYPEPVAWLVERERDGTFPRLHHRKDDARRLVESITVHPKASMHPLYIQPPTSVVLGGYIPMPVIDWVGTDAPDPRDAYTTRINGHIIGIHSDEERARNHAWAIEAYIKDTAVPTKHEDAES